MVLIKEKFRCRDGDKVHVRDPLAEARGDSPNAYRVEEAGAPKENLRPLVTGGPLAQLRRNTELYKQRHEEPLQQGTDASRNVVEDCCQSSDGEVPSRVQSLTSFCPGCFQSGEAKHEALLQELAQTDKLDDHISSDIIEYNRRPQEKKYYGAGPQGITGFCTKHALISFLKKLSACACRD